MNRKVAAGISAGALALTGAGASIASCGPTPPSEPLNPSAVAAEEFTLTWDATPTATGYRIYRGTAPGNEAFLATSVTNSYVDEITETVYYQVSAVNEQGEGPRSAEIVVPGP